MSFCKTLTPVAVFTYNRLSHTQQTLETLNQSPLASKTELYVFCDNYKKEKDVDSVNAVRSYVDQFSQKSNFLSVHVVKAEKNQGLAKSIINGVSTIIEKCGRIIVVEDDLITSGDFLQYMNDALDFYETDSDIWSISGYSFPMKALKKYKHDVFLSGRGSSWGWATWIDRWATIDWDVSDYSDFSNSPKMRNAFSAWGADMPYMLDDQMAGRINSWAIRWCYSQFKQKKYTIYPVSSRVVNIGTDGSGTHFSRTDNRYQTTLYNGTEKCVFENVSVDKKIQKEFKRKYGGHLSRMKWAIMRYLKIKK